MSGCDGDCDYLAKKVNPHPRDAAITFDEGPHIYTINGDSSFMSVTTFNGAHFSKFDADEIIKKMMKSPKWINSQYYNMKPNEIKASWAANGKEASQLGTDLHYYIESYYNNAVTVSTLLIKERLLRDDPVSMQYFHNFAHDFRKSVGFKPYRTEWMIYDEEHKLAGSIDMLVDLCDGTFAIYDWKRSKEIKKVPFNDKSYAITECINHLPDTNYWKYSLQLNTYKKILQDNYGLTISEMHLVVLHPNNNNNDYKRITIPDLSNDVDALFKLRKESI